MVKELLTGLASPQILNTWTTKAPYVTGVDIKTTDVFNIAYGQVVYVGQDNNRYVVCVKCNNNEVLRYCNLLSLSVLVNAYIDQGAKIGTASEYVHLEYVTSWKGSSVFPVRINQYTYYKQNPQDIIDDKYTVEPLSVLQYGADAEYHSVTYTDLQKSEFTGGKW